MVHCLTGLVVLVDFFFNSLIVGVPCCLIFWCFWLFIDFRLVVILLLVVRGNEGFLPMPPSWPGLSILVFDFKFLVVLLLVVWEDKVYLPMPPSWPEVI